MSSFRPVYLIVGSLVGASGLEAYPEDYKGNISNESLYGRYSISFNDREREDFGDGSVMEGLIFFRIFYDRNNGHMNAVDYAGTLEDTFDRFIDNTLTINYSTLSQPQDDPNNEALGMMVWQASFTKHL